VDWRTEFRKNDFAFKIIPVPKKGFRDRAIELRKSAIETESICQEKGKTS